MVRLEDFDGAAPRKSHWRAWLAAAVVLVFVVLGTMEWRAQSNQTDNGPVEVMKAKVRNWKNGGQSQLADQPAEPSTDNSTKPDMQVQEQPKPQQQHQAANPAQNPSASSNAPTSSSLLPRHAAGSDDSKACDVDDSSAEAGPECDSSAAEGTDRAECFGHWRRKICTKLAGLK